MVVIKAYIILFSKKKLAFEQALKYADFIPCLLT